MKTILLLFLLVVNSTSAISPLSATARLKDAEINGTVRLDCSDDSVFAEVFRLISNSNPDHTLIAFEPPPVFLAWSTQPTQQKLEPNIIPDSAVITFHPRTRILTLLKQVARTRGRVVVELPNGWFLHTKAKAIPKRKEIIPDEERAKGSQQILLWVPIKSVTIKNSTPSDILSFVNANLRRTAALVAESDVPGKLPNRFAFKAFQIRGLEHDDEQDRQIEQEARLWLLGPVSYSDLLYLYGVVFKRAFSWKSPTILRETVLHSTTLKSARQR